MRVWLLGAGPGEKVDFARFNFHVPTTGSAANAALVPIARMAPTNRVLTMLCMCPPKEIIYLRSSRRGPVCCCTSKNALLSPGAQIAADRWCALDFVLLADVAFNGARG